MKSKMMKLKIQFAIFIISTQLLLNISGNSTVDYYVNLINQEIARAYTYVLPTDASAHKSTLASLTIFGTFDYIIVGAGSAGAVIANRLTEISKNKVLLLEAGGEESDFSDIPAMATFLTNLEFNWNYNSTTQTTCCLGYLNQQCPYPRGKSLGGTSTINIITYSRGNKEDYDSWHKAGNFGWSYQDVLPYFKKSERSRLRNVDEEYHGKDGYLHVEHSEDDSPLLEAFFEANQKLGRDVVDYNGKQQLGVAKSQFNTNKGRRDSTGRAFLEPVMNRKNLNILTHSFVIKILIKPKTKTAYGVLFTHKGRLFIAKARKEVILSAGSVGSPQLLLLSGIGPKEHLNNLGIPVLHTLPVGRNLQDHPFYPALFFKTNYTEPSVPLEEDVKKYLNGRGPLSIPGNSQGIGFYQMKPINTSSSRPDIEVIMVPPNSTHDFMRIGFHLTDETYNSVWKKINTSNTFNILLIGLHPKSRGELKLKSKDPYEYPLINSNYLSDTEGKDIETMYEAIKIALEMVDTEPFKRFNATLVPTTVPECEKHKYLSREYWYCQLRQLTFHLFHPIGTCKMGPDCDDGAVVNHELKVCGIKRLRVADASIIPNTVSGHTNAPTMMIGEKVADMIKATSKFIY